MVLICVYSYIDNLVLLMSKYAKSFLKQRHYINILKGMHVLKNFFVKKVFTLNRSFVKPSSGPDLEVKGTTAYDSKCNKSSRKFSKFQCL